MPGFVAYYRVSTDRQGASGLGLDAQRATVASYLAHRGDLVAEFTEIESGRRNDRPELAAALGACRKHHTALVIARLDRLARNLAFVANLMESGVEFVAVDMPDANRLTLHVMAAFAEHEREMISKRTREALTAAKARGVRLGNPRAREALAIARAARQRNVTALAPEVSALIATWREQGKGLRQIARELNQRNIRTPGGKEWHAQTVKDRLYKHPVEC